MTRLPIRLTVLALVLGLLTACGAMSNASRRNPREEALYTYVSAVRWGDFNAALTFVAAPELILTLFPKYDGAAPAVRILCAVAVLRAIGFVAPPLLDGVGFPQRTLRYMIVAAIAMPASYIIGAITLGDTLGFESVAVAWAVGYPIAFIVLIWLAYNRKPTANAAV